MISHIRRHFIYNNLFFCIVPSVFYAFIRQKFFQSYPRKILHVFLYIVFSEVNNAMSEHNSRSKRRKIVIQRNHMYQNCIPQPSSPHSSESSNDSLHFSDGFISSDCQEHFKSPNIINDEISLESSDKSSFVDNEPENDIISDL